MREHSSGLDVSQGTGGILRLVISQEAIVQKCIVSSNAELVRVFEVYPPNDVELLARKHFILVALIVGVQHLLVRLNVPVIVVFVFHCGFVEHLSRTDMIVATKTVE